MTVSVTPDLAVTPVAEAGRRAPMVDRIGMAVAIIVETAHEQGIASALVYVQIKWHSVFFGIYSYPLMPSEQPADLRN
jgi:hypothetical protein